MANLTGLSHGAAGAALALHALSTALNEKQYADAAREAVAYESSLFDSAVGNWPDLRTAQNGFDNATPARTFATYWCHGAPGILIGRLFMSPIAGGQGLAELTSALKTTRSAVRQMLISDDNYCVCHGIVGTAEALFLARMTKGTRTLLSDDAATLPEHVADVIVEKYINRSLNCPTGIYHGRNPSMFLGSAGIGRYLLRLHDPALSSITIPTDLMPMPLS